MINFIESVAGEACHLLPVHRLLVGGAGSLPLLHVQGLRFQRRASHLVC